MEGTISVEFCHGKDPLLFSGEKTYLVEKLVIDCCQHLSIGPVSRHLFALWCSKENLWFPLSHEFDLSNGKAWSLCFRLRFRTPNVRRLVEKTDLATFNYFFHQARNDFLKGNIPELFRSHLREVAMGLVATDIIRVLSEKKLTPETMKYNSRDFLPQELKRSLIFDNFLHDPLQKAVTRGYKNSRQNPDFVKETYLQQLLELVPEYGSESYPVVIDELGKVFEVELVVNPYSVNYPGLRMRTQRGKEVWTHVCSIEELCYVSMRHDLTVEISRSNGIPNYLQFKNVAQMHSFVSAVDGYYRLSEKWNFNLCKDLSTPSLISLRVLKCHGPVGHSFAHQKLRDKGSSETNCYVLRESERAYNHYLVDFWKGALSNGKREISTLTIKRKDDLFSLLDGDKCFPSIPQLLSDISKSNGLNFLKCIPPSEYDKTDLLLCRRESQDKNSQVTRGDCNCSAQCIPHDAIDFSQSRSEICGKITSVSYSQLKKSCTESKAVVVKSLLREYKASYLAEFLSQCDKVLFWQHDAIVGTVGMILHPTAIVLEWLPLGTLDKYLQNNRDTLRQVDLVEASYHLARALWYLEGQRAHHGNIRCHNVLVAIHTENSFKVKLADPGVILYDESDIHWIPPEHYNDFSKASKSNSADVYAFGTTLWQIFSYGEKPLTGKESKTSYQNGNTLSFPSDMHKDMERLILECWLFDPDNRKRPQAIVRDVNQILYEVYNSRRNHSYAIINTAAIPVPQNDVCPPLPPTRPPKEGSRKILKNVFKWPSASGPTKTFSYNSLSQSTSATAYSNQSASSYLTDDRESNLVPSTSMGLISIGETYPALDTSNLSPSDLSWIIDKEQLTIDAKIGEGFYGEVSIATLNYGAFVSEKVAVKRIRSRNQCQIVFNDLKREMDIMKRLSHKNIVQIKGLVEEPETMLVMEYVDRGSILLYVQSFKDTPEKLDFSEVLTLALGVAEGMEYLETQSIVHRDLAARNILLGSENTVKISDFGLAQVIKDHYYKMTTERNLPIRWYSYESIFEGKFSHLSDVWSYGVTLWEMYSYGENPTISDADDNTLLEALQQGLRLPKPLKCPSIVYQFMRRCWEQESRERPPFTEIITILKGFQLELYG